MTTDPLTIQHVAELTGLGVHTLRYYERVGLIHAIRRAASGHRRYSPEDVAWLAFLTRLRATGMPISGMQEFAALRREGAASVARRRVLLEAHRRAVRERVSALEQHLGAIDEKVRYYRSLEGMEDRHGADGIE